MTSTPPTAVFTPVVWFLDCFSLLFVIKMHTRTISTSRVGTKNIEIQMCHFPQQRDPGRGGTEANFRVEWNEHGALTFPPEDEFLQQFLHDGRFFWHLCISQLLAMSTQSLHMSCRHLENKTTRTKRRDGRHQSICRSLVNYWVSSTEVSIWKEPSIDVARAEQGHCLGRKAPTLLFLSTTYVVVCMHMFVARFGILAYRNTSCGVETKY